MKLERIVILTGIDGSGKTQHARILASDYLKSGTKCRYVWMRSAYFFSLPFMTICRVLGFTGVHRLEDSVEYSEHIYNKKPIVFLWPWIQLVDVILYVATKIYVPLIQGYRLVVDRFVYDILVDVMVDVNKPELYKTLVGRLMLSLIPSHAITFLFDIDEDTALKRKNDIPDKRYLTKRRSHYLALARYQKIVKIDSSSAFNDVQGLLLQRLKERRAVFAMNHIEEQLRNRLQARARWKKWKKGPVAMLRRFLNEVLRHLMGTRRAPNAESIHMADDGDSSGGDLGYDLQSYIKLLRSRGLELHSVVILGSRAKNRWNSKSDIDTLVIASGLPIGITRRMSLYTRAHVLSDMPLFLGVQAYGCTREEFLERLSDLDLPCLDAVCWGKIVFDDGFWSEVNDRFKVIEEEYGIQQAVLKRKLFSV
jgi:thymidylate kinase